MLPTEADGHWQRDRSRRYFGPPSLRAERSARLKRWRRPPQHEAKAAEGPWAGGGGGGNAAAMGLLASRKTPAQQRPAPERRQQSGLHLPAPNFLPLRPEEEASRQQQAQQQLQGAPQRGSAAAELAAEQEARRREGGESNEELLLRRTREFNVATRERPHDVQLWLQFARFQARYAEGPA